MRGLTDREREEMVDAMGSPDPTAEPSSPESCEICDALAERGLGRWVEVFGDGWWYFDVTPEGKLALELDTLARTKVEP